MIHPAEGIVRGIRSWVWHLRVCRVGLILPHRCAKSTGLVHHWRLWSAVAHRATLVPSQWFQDFLELFLHEVETAPHAKRMTLPPIPSRASLIGGELAEFFRVATLGWQYAVQTKGSKAKNQRTERQIKSTPASDATVSYWFTSRYCSSRSHH